MGLVEGLLEHVSWRSVAFYVAAAYVLWTVVIRIDQYSRLRRLGNRGPMVKYYIPGGFDFVYRSIKALWAQKDLELWRSYFDFSGSWTAEANVTGVRIIFTADHENIKAILATQFGDFGKGEPFHQEWKDFLGDSIFTTDGDQWHASRSLVRPQFIKDRISDLHCFESHLQTLFRAMANGGVLQGEDQPVDMTPVASNGKSLDISDLFFRYTLDVTTDFLLGQDVKSMTTPVQDFAEAFNYVQYVQSLISRAGPLNPLISRTRQRQSLRTMNNFVNHYVDLALQLSPAELASKTKADQGYTFLHELANYTRDRTVLRDQIVAVLLAGRDTTASTLSWAIYELGKHPEVVAKLRREILDTIGTERIPTYSDLKGMKYLQNVMNEVLRLYPAVPYNVRLALKDTTLPRGGGRDGSEPLPVLKDTPIAYSTLVMQRRQDLYPTAAPGSAADEATAAGTAPAEAFCPERWFHWQPRHWQYIPFNGGPRICIGQQFALTEMGYVLARMFQRFDRVSNLMSDIDGGKPVLKAEIVLSPSQGVQCAFWQPEQKQEEEKATH